MKRFFILALVALIGFAMPAAAQQYQEVVYLKNGSVIKGTVIEQIPGQSVKVQTQDGSVFVYTMDEVEKVVKEMKSNYVRKPAFKKPAFNWKNKGYRPTGYAWFIDAEYTSGKEFLRSQYIGLGTTHGYQFNPYIFVGVGAEFQVALDVAWSNDAPVGKPEVINDGKKEINSFLQSTEISGNDFGAVVYGNIRLFLFDNKYSPYLDLRAGYSTSAKGCYFSPMIGVSIGRFDIGIGGVFQDVELYDTYCDYIWKYNYNPNVYDYMWVEENVRTSSTNKLRGGFNVRIGVNF